MKKLLLTGIIGFSLISPVTGKFAYADDQKKNDQYVSRKQYDQLKDEMTKLKEQVQFLLQQQSQQITTQQPVASQPVQQAKTEQDITELQEEVKTLKAQNEALDDGTTGFLLTGYAFAGYTDAENSNSSFNAGFNPIFLWRLREDLIFEGELELELEDDTTNVSLEFAQLSYLLNDYITIGAGQFLNPSNYFIERLHPTWINKLPDKPITMVGNTRLQANSQLGLQVRGGVPLGSMRGEYALYVSNGPAMRNDGTLRFNNFSDINNNKAVGGRIGWLPFTGFELGYGFEVAGVDDLNGDKLDVITHSVDFNYLLASRKYLLGNVDINAQYANRQVDRSSDPTLAFNNQSSGGYAQVAYRPSLSGIPLLVDFESVLRYDWIDLPSAPGFYDEQRWTVGLNYYLAASTMVKFAYQFDNKQGAANDNALIFQVTSGF
jgi:hypothetical protein